MTSGLESAFASSPGVDVDYLLTCPLLAESEHDDFRDIGVFLEGGS